jgi:RNA polymerase sigma-70 factor, ECF subfamily
MIPDFRRQEERNIPSHQSGRGRVWILKPCGNLESVFLRTAERVPLSVGRATGTVCPGIVRTTQVSAVSECETEVIHHKTIRWEESSMRTNSKTGQPDQEFLDNLLSHQSPEMDRSDFEQTAIPHMSVLYNRALYLTRNCNDAQDLIQETFLKAFRFWDKFEKGTNITGWLTQIMRNSYINHYRREAKTPRALEFDEQIYRDDSAGDVTAAHPAGEQRSPGDIFEDAIASSLESLPRTFRTVVMMSDLEGFTYDEIANAIAVPVGTVRSRLHRGRKMLRQKLEPYARTNRHLL